MVYDRRIRDQELNFEASGALLDASLVMRDRETDSWWSIMSSRAIGGELRGADLVELPVGEKTTWGEWRRRHPDTLVLSVDGAEHESFNPYDSYFASSNTFRGLRIKDQRLEPKAPIFSFWLGKQAYAAPHAAFEGGRLFRLEELGERRLLLFRRHGSSFFASTTAYVVDEDLAAKGPDRLLERVKSGSTDGLEPLPGIDTFWYTWISVNKDSKLLR